MNKSAVLILLASLLSLASGLRGKEGAKDNDDIMRRGLKMSKGMKLSEEFKGIEVVDIDTTTTATKEPDTTPTGVGTTTKEPDTATTAGADATTTKDPDTTILTTGAAIVDIDDEPPCKGKSCKKREKARSSPGLCSCECSDMPCECECDFPRIPVFAEDGTYKIAEMKGPIKKLQKKLVKEKARIDKRQAQKQARLDDEEDDSGRRLCDGEACALAADPTLMCFCHCLSFPCPCSCGALQSFQTDETPEPTTAPTDEPTNAPTMTPTDIPTTNPTAEPSTPAPTLEQESPPTLEPSAGASSAASSGGEEDESPTLEPSAGASSAASAGEEEQDSPTLEPSTAATSSSTDPSTSDLDIENLIMVDVGNNIDISSVQDCSGCLTNETVMSVRAEPFTPEDVGSVYLEIFGVISDTETDNEAPYTLFGDTGGVLTGQMLPVGAYLIKAQAYSEPDLGGESGEEATAYFYVVEK